MNWTDEMMMNPFMKWISLERAACCGLRPILCGLMQLSCETSGLPRRVVAKFS